MTADRVQRDAQVIQGPRARTGVGGAAVVRFPYRLKRRPEERVQVLGAAMDLVKPAEMLHFAEGQIAAGRKTIVANHNLHSLYLMRRRADVRAFFEKADLIEVDSIPLAHWARLVGRPSRTFHRCTYLDWREDFCRRAAANGWRVFFVGGALGVGERAAEAIRARWPGVRLETHHGYFDKTPGSAQNEAVLQAIADHQPDVLLIGMGMPLQEVWALQNHDRFPACVVFTIGGAFDYEAGVQLTAPRWIGRIGLEWLFRLLVNPRRMFGRYCIEPWSLIGPAIDDVRMALRRRD